MKITSPRVIVIQEDGQKPVLFTDPRKAAEHWARAKADSWGEKNLENPVYKPTQPGRYYRMTISYQLHGDVVYRYRKLKRRALRVFRRVMDS